MFQSFTEIEQFLLDQKIKKTVVLAGSHDALALGALVRVKQKNLIDVILIGDAGKTCELLRGMDEDPQDYEIIDEKKEFKIASLAMKLVNDGKADIPMKGLLQTSSFLMALQSPRGGLMVPGGLINEVTVYYYPDQDRLMLAGDCAINIAPDLEQKKKITGNMIGLARALHADPVRVAALSVIEKANPTIPSSVDAKTLTQEDWGADVVIDGPFALDNVLDEEAARHKGIESPVAGHADVIVMPDIHAGNVFHKCLHYFGHFQFASGTLGARTPVIMNSRTDDEDGKYYSILIALLQAIEGA